LVADGAITTLWRRSLKRLKRLTYLSPTLSRLLRPRSRAFFFGRVRATFFKFSMLRILPKTLGLRVKELLETLYFIKSIERVDCEDLGNGTNRINREDGGERVVDFDCVN
jgi:hypothetical protein